MNRLRILRLFFIIGTVLFVSCNKNIIPRFNPERAGKEYEQARFDYVFIEATKQKLLGNAGEALKHFEQCLLLNPESDASYYQMAQIMLNNGNLESGKKYIKKAAQLQPGNIWYLMTLAGVYYQQKNLDSAIICYEKAVKTFPEREGLQISLANLYTENKKYEKARNILSRLDEKYGINENTTISLIRTLMAEGKFREARGKIEQLLEQNPDNIIFNGLLAEAYRGEKDNGKAFNVYKQLIERNPGNPEVQLSLCDFLLTERNYSELFILLDSVIGNERIGKEEKITLIASLIENQEIVRNFELPLETAVRKMEEYYENDEIVLMLRPDLLQKSNKPDKAAMRLEEIIKIKPDYYFAWEKLLLVYYDMKDFLNLEGRGKECATRFNRSVLAKLLYASGASENGNYEVALEELRKADILAGTNKEIKLQVLTMKADVYYRMKNFTEAFKTFEEAVALNDTDMTVLNNYAYYLAEQDMKLKEAEQMAKTVIDKEKDNTTFLDTYAWVLFKRGKTREAARVMEKIINSGQSDDAEWYEHYGFILRKMGKCTDAIEKWEKAISIDSSKSNLQKEIDNCKK